MLLRRGEKRRPHFAHRRGEGCSAESVLHRAAKGRLVEVVEAWLLGSGPRPCIARRCPTFGCEGGIVQDIPDNVTQAREEVRLDDGSVADIVLYRDDAPAVVVEIVVTHRVSEEKARRLALPWVALLAEDVVMRPYWWVAVQDGLLPFACSACSRRDARRVAALGDVEQRARRLADHLGQPVPGLPYRLVAHECWRCRTPMIVFLWPGAGHSDRRPPLPIPTTVRHRVTEGAGDYWANCCPRCSVVQGDYYLERDNPDYAVVRELSRIEGDP